MITPWFIPSVFSQDTRQGSTDLDSDGVADSIDIDQDNDGIVNELEGVQRLTSLSGRPARYFSANPTDTVVRGPSVVYDLIDNDTGRSATLTGEVLASDTEIEWSMQNALPKLRNLTSGSTVVRWSIDAGLSVGNVDFTISDLDGVRSETVTLAENALVGYSLSLNSNVSVHTNNGQLIFTGTGQGGESIDDLVVLHFREASEIVLTYSNNLSVADDAAAGEVLTDEAIAGYRHNLQRQSFTFFTPVTQYRDTDGDGIADHRDLDSDNDGLGDVVESGGVDADHDNLIDGPINNTGLSVNADAGLDVQSVAAVYVGSATVTGGDEDNDGLLSSVDAMPQQFGGSRSGSDSDNDGLDDLDEIRLHGTRPDNPDSDSDGLTDEDEINQYNTDPLLDDTDTDGLSDAEEIMVHATNPNSDDSDADGLSDGVEIESGTDPLVSDNISIVLPSPVTPEPQPEPQPAQDAVETPIVPVAQDLAVEAEVPGEADNNIEPDSGALLADDPESDNAASLRTGLGGIVGCTITSAGITPAPLLPMILFFAVAALVRRTGRRSSCV